MGLVHKLLLVILPVLGILTAVLQPAWKDLRILASVGQPLNNDRCTPIPGTFVQAARGSRTYTLLTALGHTELEACEDAWILQRKGLAYLCVTRELSLRDLTRRVKLLEDLAEGRQPLKTRRGKVLHQLTT